MPAVSQKDIKNLYSLKRTISCLIFKHKDKDLVPVYDHFSNIFGKGNEKALNLITRYIYYDLALKGTNFSQGGLSEFVSKTFTSKLEKEAYLQYLNFNKIKENYKIPLEIEPSREFFWYLAVKKINKFIKTHHHDTPFEVTE